jgi:branched-chain amino acid transport system substrate-binding protein
VALSRFYPNDPKRYVPMTLTKKILSLLLFLYIPNQSLLAQDKDLKIGVLLCLSGDCAEWGENSLNGVKLAVEEINTNGGIKGQKIKLEVEDSRETSPASAVTAFNKLLTDPTVSIIIGPSWSPAGMAVAPIAAKHPNIILISPSLSLRTFNETANNIFKTFPHEETLTKRIAQYALEKGWTRGAIFSSQQATIKAQGDIFEKAFTSGGGKVILKLEPLPDSTDFRTEVTRIKEIQSDFVFLSNWSGLSAKQLKNSGYTGPVITYQMDDQRLKTAEGALEGAVFAVFPETSEEFISKYERKYSKLPGVSADSGYDTI